MKMDARKIEFSSMGEAIRAIDAVGSGNSRFMACRAIHINVLIRNVPGAEAKLLKTTYNDIGAEAAISHHAYHGEEGVVTDMIVMGTVYQHREVRRILLENQQIQPWVQEIATVVENSPEILE
jgi:hypothetical protein